MLTHTRCNAHTYSTRSERDPFKEKVLLLPECWVEQRQCPQIQKYKYIRTFTHCCGCVSKWVWRFSQDCKLINTIHYFYSEFKGHLIFYVYRHECDTLQCTVWENFKWTHVIWICSCMTCMSAEPLKKRSINSNDLHLLSNNQSQSSCLIRSVSRNWTSGHVCAQYL